MFAVTVRKISSFFPEFDLLALFLGFRIGSTLLGVCSSCFDPWCRQGSWEGVNFGTWLCFRAARVCQGFCGLQGWPNGG